MTDHVITFEYLNHAGKKQRRKITVDAVEFIGKVNYGYQPGWFISGFCHDKQARRSFALSRIIFDDSEFNHKKHFTLMDLRHD